MLFHGTVLGLEGWGRISHPKPCRQLLLPADPANPCHARVEVGAACTRSWRGGSMFTFLCSGLGKSSSASLSIMLRSKPLPTTLWGVWMCLGMLKEGPAWWEAVSFQFAIDTPETSCFCFTYCPCGPCSTSPMWSFRFCFKFRALFDLYFSTMQRGLMLSDLCAQSPPFMVQLHAFLCWRCYFEIFNWLQVSPCALMAYNFSVW